MGQKVGELVDDKYLLERKLGAGGMATIFQAVHRQIGKTVAIKFLHPSLCADEGAVKRFRREAQAAAAIGHPGIIDIHDIGVTEDDAPYLVMEFLKGETLGERLEREAALDPSLAAYVMAQTLSALAAAHDAKVVHRDLKPANLFLVDNGTPLPSVKLLDFGISRFLGPSPVSGSDPSLRLTKDGEMVGTPFYMSPEHAEGEVEVDHRTDIYSAGAVLYECLSGRTPFLAENYNALLACLLTDDPPRLRSIAPEVPEELGIVVHRALARDPEGRYQLAASMLNELLPFVERSAKSRIPLTPSSMPSYRRAESEAKVEEVERGSALWSTPTVAASPWKLDRSKIVAGLLLSAVLTVLALFFVFRTMDAPANDGDFVDGDQGRASGDASVSRESDGDPVVDAPGSAVEDSGAVAEGGAERADSDLPTKGDDTVDASRIRMPRPLPQPTPASKVKGRLGTTIETEYQ